MDRASVSFHPICILRTSQTRRVKARSAGNSGSIGYLVDLAYERGTVDTSFGLDELKRPSDITARARSADDLEDLSKAIGKGLPPRPLGSAPAAATPTP